MATPKKRVNFYESDEGLAARKLLLAMEADGDFNTPPSYSADLDRYPDKLMPFVEKHMTYLNVHPDLEPRHYIANLRLMTRKR